LSAASSEVSKNQVALEITPPFCGVVLRPELNASIASGTSTDARPHDAFYWRFGKPDDKALPVGLNYSSTPE